MSTEQQPQTTTPSERGLDPEGVLLTSFDDSNSYVQENSNNSSEVALSGITNTSSTCPEFYSSEVYVPSCEDHALADATAAAVFASDVEESDPDYEENKQQLMDRAVAEALQRKFDESLIFNDILAAGSATRASSKQNKGSAPVVPDNSHSPSTSLSNNMDEAVAAALQRHFDESFEQRRQRESDESMRSTNTGKALHFVQCIIANHERILRAFLAHDDSNHNNNNNNNNNNADSDAQPQQQQQHPANMFRLVNVDDMVFLAERVFALQEQFARQNKDTVVDVGYHYTNSANLASIRTDGLLTSAERNAHMIPTVTLQTRTGRNGSIFGDGIYTANNPFSYHNFGGGDIGLLVCRLKGMVEISRNEIDMPVSSNHSHTQADTLLGRSEQTDEVCVLSSSQQCVALVQYNSSLVQLNDDAALGNRLVYEYHCSLQSIVDECFNNNNNNDSVSEVHTPVRLYLPSQVIIRTLLAGVAALRRSVTTFSKTLREIIFYSTPIKAKRNASGDEQGLVSFLFDPKTNPGAVVMLYNGAHQEREEKSLYQPWMYHITYLPQKFEFECGTLFYMVFSKKDIATGESIPLAWPDIYDNEHILKRIRACAEKHCKTCSKCRKSTGKGKLAIGSMPTGIMRIDRFSELVCAGHPKGTLLISYKFEPGNRPGYFQDIGFAAGEVDADGATATYRGTFRMSYVPDTTAGQDLVRRLKFAFTRGLVFRVGTSQTTGLSNSIVWGTIPHKTTLESGEFGFPDETYLERANVELDKLGVPPASSL